MRSRSLNEYEDIRATDLTERMKHTFDFKFKGFKANTRGNFIHNLLVTFKEVLQKLPESIGLHVELSMFAAFLTNFKYVTKQASN